MITVFQLFHSGIDVDPTEFFELAPPSATRGHAWKLQKPHAATRVKRNLFAVRVISDWNSLPPNVVAAETVNQFKAKLDKHWAHCTYDVPIQDG